MSLPGLTFMTRKIEVGGVYFVPDAQSIPATSIIHEQSRQNGFFSHPCLVTNIVQDKWAVFYAMSSRPPKAIGELKMFLTIGSTSEEKGPAVLSLAKNSPRMNCTTIINLEQLYRIEKEYLGDWKVNVHIDLAEFAKINARVNELEAEQNRFIYKPIGRDLTSAGPGTVLMLPNPKGAPTFGGPVLVVGNDGSRVHYLRIKSVQDNQALHLPLNPDLVSQRSKYLLMKKELCYGHDQTPVLLYSQGSPEMREPSYVEITKKIASRALNEMKTWCFPHVQLAPHSMRVLFQYIDNFQEPQLMGPRHTSFRNTNFNAHRPRIQRNSAQQPLQPLTNYSGRAPKAQIASPYDPQQTHGDFSYPSQHFHTSFPPSSLLPYGALSYNSQQTMHDFFRPHEMTMSPMNMGITNYHAYTGFNPQAAVYSNFNNGTIGTGTEQARQMPTGTPMHEMLPYPTLARNDMGTLFPENFPYSRIDQLTGMPFSLGLHLLLAFMAHIGDIIRPGSWLRKGAMRPVRHENCTFTPVQCMSCIGCVQFVDMMGTAC
jgi:hypothetical protein